jgi:hypothetical protein
MVDGLVQIAPDSTGKKVDTSEITVGSNTVERQRVVLSDPASATGLVNVTTTGALQVQAIDPTATGSITTQNLNPNSGTPTAGSTVTIAQLNDNGCVGIQVTGTYTGALTPQATIDGVNWVTLGVLSLFNVNFSYNSIIPSASVGMFQCDVSGFKGFRITALAAMTGTAIVSLQVSGQQGFVKRVAIVGGGTQNIDATIGTAIATTAVAVTPAPNNQAAAACSVGLAAAQSVLNIKNTAGNVYGLSIQNPNASVIFLQFYNTTGTPVLGTFVIWFIAVPASGTVTIPPGTMALANHAAGIGIGASTSATSTGTPGTAPNVTIFYK